MTELKSLVSIEVTSAQAVTGSNAITDSLNKTSTAATSAKSSTSKYNQTLNDTNRDSRSAASSVDSLTSSVSNSAKNVILYGASFLSAGAAIASIINENRKLETALIGVSKTTNMAGKDLDNYKNKILALTQTLPVTSAELFELTQVAGQMGVKGVDNLEKFATTVAKLGRASDLSGEQAAKSLARILNVSGESITEIDTLSSVIVSLGNNIAATESEIAKMTGEVARGVSVFGIASAESAALGGALASIGVQAELGGSSVGRTMAAINEAVLTGGKNLKEFAGAFNLDSEKLESLFNVDKMQAFNYLLEGVRDTGARAGIALESVGLGGQEIAKTILPLANNLRILEETQKLANAETKNATALNKEYEATLSTFDSQLIILGNNLTKIKTEMGGSIFGGLTDGLTAINEFAASDDFENLVDTVSVLSIVIGSKLASAMASSAKQAIVALDVKRLENLAYAESNVRAAKEIENQKLISVARVSSLQAVQAQLLAEQNLEKTRLAAQINDKGRIDTINRMAALGVQRANVTNQLAAAEAKQIALTNASAAANTKAASSLAALTLTARAATAATAAASGAMALLGGPVGVALIAAGSLYYFATQASEAEKQVEKLGESTEDTIAIFNEMNAAQQRLVVQEVTEQLEKQTDVIEGLNRQLRVKQGLQDMPTDSSTVAIASVSDSDLDAIRSKLFEAEKVAESLRAKLGLVEGATVSLSKAAQNNLQKLTDPFASLESAIGLMPRNFGVLKSKGGEAFSMVAASAVRASEKIGNVDDSTKKIIASLQKQIDLYGNESREAEALYDLKKGNIKIEDEAQKKNYIAANKRLDALDKESKKLAQMKTLMQEMEEIELEDDPFAEHEIDTKEFDDLINSIDEFGGAWTRSGSIAVDAIGTISDAIEDYALNLDAISKKEEELKQARLETNDPKKIEEISKAKIKLEGEVVKANLKGYGQMAGAAASMFKEQSKERKALHNIEMGFAAVEMAMSIKNTAQELMLTYSRTSAAAVEGVVSQSKGDPYTAFARMAAMAAIMAALGYAVSGGSGGGGGGVSVEEMQERQGTGTVLGSDDKSESIMAAFENYEEVGIDSLAELREIRNGINNLSSGIAQLAISLVTGKKFTGGGVAGLGDSQSVLAKDLFPGFGNVDSTLEKILPPMGLELLNDALGDIFGKTSKKLRDSGLSFDSQTLGDILAGKLEADYYSTIETTKKKLFGLSKKTTTKDELAALDSGAADEITRIFSYVADTVDGSIKSLGVDTAKTINDFVLSVGKVSFKDLSGEEIEAELEALFSQQADKLAAFVMPDISEYQKMGEGAFQTLTRVAKEQAIFNDAIDDMGLNLGDLSAILRIDVAQNIIDLMGGLEKFGESTKSYFNDFYDKNEKIEMLGDSLGEAFAGINKELPTTKQGFRNVVEGLDLTTEADQKLFASLMELSPSLAEYLEAIEDQNVAFKSANDVLKERQSLEDRLFQLTATELQLREKQLSLLDDTVVVNGYTNKQIQEQIYTQIDYADALKITEQAQAEATKELENLQKQLFNLTATDLEKELSVLASLRGDEARAVQEQIYFAEKQKIIDSELFALQKQFYDLTTSDQQKRLDSLAALQSDEARAVQGQINAYNDRILATDNFTNSFASAIDSVAKSVSASAQEIKATYENLLSSISSARSNVMASVQRFETPKTVEELKSSLSGKDTNEQIKIIEQINSALGSRYDSEIQEIQQQRDSAKSAYEEKAAYDQKVYQTEASNAQKIAEANLGYQKKMLEYTNKMVEAADSLLLSDLSPLLATEKLKISQKAFEQANGEDLIQASNDYLKNAREFYASGEDYTEIFNNVQSALRSAAANPQSFVPQDSVQLDSVPDFVASTVTDFDGSKFDSQIEAIKNSYKNSFYELLPKLDELQDLAAIEFENSMIELSKKAEEENAKLLSELQLQTQALNLIPEKLSETNAALLEQLQAAVAMIDETRKQTAQNKTDNEQAANRDDALNRRILELTETIEKNRGA